METYKGNKKLQTNLRRTKPDLICPRPELVLEALRLTAPQDVKVIVIEQDPYHTVGTAHGLSFSSKTGMTPSLNVIFEELDRTGYARTDTDLTSWANQGVLLLNTILTTQVGIPLAHKHYGWQLFTAEVVRHALSYENPTVVMLWDREAKEFYNETVRTLLTEKHHIKVLEAVHPVAQARQPQKHRFVGCNHFTEANEWLELWGQDRILWQE